MTGQRPHLRATERPRGRHLRPHRRDPRGAQGPCQRGGTRRGGADVCVTRAEQGELNSAGG